MDAARRPSMISFVASAAIRWISSMICIAGNVEIEAGAHAGAPLHNVCVNNNAIH
jgi:hypothetical protein